MARLPINDNRMQAALYYARKRRVARINGGGVVPPPEPEPEPTGPMIIEFTADGGAGTNFQFSFGGPTDVVIDWGDGSTTVKNTPGYSLRLYPSTTATFTITVTGSTRSLSLIAGDKAFKVVTFGAFVATDLSYFVAGNTGLISLPSRIPVGVTNLSNAFQETPNFAGDIGKWDVSSVTNLSYAFYLSGFTGDISKWNTGSVIDMSGMFTSNAAFNGSLNDWNVANVVNMSGMFTESTAFNQPLDKWNVAKVEDMSYMFSSSTAFNQDLSSWCVTLQPVEPESFAAPSILSLVNYPVWGTCP